MNSLAGHLAHFERLDYLAPGQGTIISPTDTAGFPASPEVCQAARTLSRTLALGPSPLPFAELLLRRTSEQQRLSPRDSETGVFLQDIPLLRSPLSSESLTEALRDRKAALSEDLGLITAADSPERCGLYLACLNHALFVTYLADLLDQGKKLPEEEHLRQAIAPLARLIPFPTLNKRLNLETLNRAGKTMVQLDLVDSVFGNASFRSKDALIISRTGAPLDELAEGTVLVPLQGPAENDHLASSELPAHRAIYRAAERRCLLHGHPRFTIAASLSRTFIDWPEDVPRIQAEPGSAELGTRLASALQSAPIAMADGHGPFATGANFGEALHHLIRLENHCRQKILDTLD